MASNTVSTAYADDKTFKQTLKMEIDDAFMPLESFKEILLDTDAESTAKLADIGVVLEALAAMARHRLLDVDARIQHDLGGIVLSLAAAGHPCMETGTILAATTQEVHHAR